jgi:CspA family cold shock protein
MKTGTVVWFNESRGFGFIRPHSGEPDVFVHITAVQKSDMRTLIEDQQIVFELVSIMAGGQQYTSKKLDGPEP